MLSLTGGLWSSDCQNNLAQASLGVKDDFLEDKPLTSFYIYLSFITQICVDFYKRYQESQPQIDSCSVGDIKRALQILTTLRRYVATKNFNPGYIEALNNYLKLVPTPLGMQINPHTVYRTVEDVDHQIRLLNSLLPTEKPQQAKDDSGEKVVSLKSISQHFWRVV